MLQGAMTFVALISGVVAGGCLAAALACFALRTKFSRIVGFSIAGVVFAAICISSSIANF